MALERFPIADTTEKTIAIDLGHNNNENNERKSEVPKHLYFNQ